jgi:hypothetical protein
VGGSSTAVGRSDLEETHEDRGTILGGGSIRGVDGSIKWEGFFFFFSSFVFCEINFLLFCFHIVSCPISACSGMPK